MLWFLYIHSFCSHIYLLSTTESNPKNRKCILPSSRHNANVYSFRPFRKVNSQQVLIGLSVWRLGALSLNNRKGLTCSIQGFLGWHDSEKHISYMLWDNWHLFSLQIRPGGASAVVVGSIKMFYMINTSVCYIFRIWLLISLREHLKFVKVDT